MRYGTTELIKLCLRRREVLEKRIILIGRIDHRVKPHGIFDGVQFSLLMPYFRISTNWYFILRSLK